MTRARVMPSRGPGDLDRLFAVGDHGGAAAGVQGHVYDAEPDLGLGPSPAASNTVTFGEFRRALRQKKSCLSHSPVVAGKLHQTHNKTHNTARVPAAWDTTSRQSH